MINFLEAVKHQLHQFVETGHSKPIHLMQNHLINDIYRAIAVSYTHLTLPTKA